MCYVSTLASMFPMFLQMWFGFFIALYVIVAIFGLLRVINGQQAHSERIRAEERELGIKPSWMTEESRDFSSFQDGVMGSVSIFKRIFSKLFATILAVFSLLFSIVFTVFPVIDKCSNL